MLYDKWWKNPGDTCTRNEKGKESKANALGVDNIGGVFVVLLCGLAVAVIVAIFEFCYNSKRNTQAEMVCTSLQIFSTYFLCGIHSVILLASKKKKKLKCLHVSLLSSSGCILYLHILHILHRHKL